MVRTREEKRKDAERFTVDQLVTGLTVELSSRLRAVLPEWQWVKTAEPVAAIMDATAALFELKFEKLTKDLEAATKELDIALRDNANLRTAAGALSEEVVRVRKELETLKSSS